MTTHNISSGVCYIEIEDSASVTITGSEDPTADIPYLFTGVTIYRVTESPTTNLTCYFQSKDFDMSDQTPTYQDLFKTVDKVQLEYVDVSSSTPVAVSLSVDGGLTWAGTTTRTIGTGTKLTRVADFGFLPVTGKMFRIKVESTSSTKDFIWTGAYVHYYVRGGFFEVTA